MNDKNNENNNQKQGGETKPHGREVEVEVNGKKISMVLTADGKFSVRDALGKAGVDVTKFAPRIYRDGVDVTAKEKDPNAVEWSPDLKITIAPTGSAELSMSEGVDGAVAELNALDKSPQRFQGTLPPDNGEVVLVDYHVPFGEHEGQRVRLGIQIPPDYNASYPHWLHLPATIKLPGRATTGKAEPEASQAVPGYMTWSRPAKKLWAEKGNRNMASYFVNHLPRVWRGVEEKK